MFCQLSTPGKTIVLVVTLSTVSGCQILDAIHPSKGERFLGTVRTGGPLATARTLPIPLEGLTLADAVETSIRPGLIAPSGSGTPGPAAPPVHAQQLTPIETIRNVVSNIAPPANGSAFDIDAAITEAASELAKLNDRSAEVEAELTTRLEEAKTEGFFPAVTSSVPDAQFRALYTDLANIIDAPAPNAINPKATTQPSPPATTDKIAVRLTRRAGNRIVIPLPMVRNYSPGDIWLADGDLIQLMPLGMTEAGQPLPNLNSNFVSQYNTAGTQPSTNLLTLIHRSVLDGQIEQYLLPATNPNYYGSVAFVQQWQNAMRVHDGDALREGSLELTPMIRKSQINTVAASAAALEERMNPTALAEKLHQKLSRLTTAVGDLPVISQVRGQIEQQVGPVSLPRPFQQTTGFSSEDFCRRLTP